MFAKLNVQLPAIDLDKIKGQLFENHHNQFVMYNIEDFEYVNELIKDRLHFDIVPDKIAYFEICTDGAPPHTDGYVGCSLNYIIDAADCVTTFWKLKNKDTVVEESIKVDNDGNILETETTGYRYSDLKLVSFFKAQSGDAWLLDVREIHSVIKPDTTKDRKVLTFRWDPVYTFQEILDSIVIL